MPTQDEECKRESIQVKAARREYEQVKRIYHKAGKKAAGKPTRSQAQRTYAVVRAEYHRLGRKLGVLTRKRERS